MKHKNISTQSGELLSYFNSQKKPCFSYKEAFEALPNANRSAIKELLSDMVRRGLLMRVKEGLYYIIRTGAANFYARLAPAGSMFGKR